VLHIGYHGHKNSMHFYEQVKNVLDRKLTPQIPIFVSYNPPFFTQVVLVECVKAR